MHASGEVSLNYSRAFAVRERMLSFRADLVDRPTWRMAAGILFDRFELAFGFFLDAPTGDRLARILAFESEMSEIAARLPDMPSRHRDGRWRQ